VSGSSPTAGHARAADYFADTVTAATHLLDHERALSDRLEALSLAAGAGRCFCTWLRFAALACPTDIGSAETDLFLHPIDCFHEFYLQIKHDVLAFYLRLLSCLATLAEHFLKLTEDISPLASLRSPELLREALEAAKSS